jgi:cytochrome c553
MTKQMKRPLSAAIAILLTVLFTTPAQAEIDLKAGKQIAYSCLGCHGIEGYRNAYPSYRVPKLGGQKAAYLVAAINGYRNGTREHPTMRAQATSLSDQDVANVAAYLATLANTTVAQGGSKGAVLEKASACVDCHGQRGISVSASWPTLAGQHRDYLEKALHQYRDGSRSDAIMGAQAALIAAGDIAILARYFAGLDGLETTLPE